MPAGAAVWLCSTTCAPGFAFIEVLPPHLPGNAAGALFVPTEAIIPRSEAHAHFCSSLVKTTPSTRADFSALAGLVSSFSQQGGESSPVAYTQAAVVDVYSAPDRKAAIVARLGANVRVQILDGAGCHPDFAVAQFPGSVPGFVARDALRTQPLSAAELKARLERTRDPRERATWAAALAFADPTAQLRASASSAHQAAAEAARRAGPVALKGKTCTTWTGGLCRSDEVPSESELTDARIFEMTRHLAAVPQVRGGP